MATSPGWQSPGDPDSDTLVDGKALADIATAPLDAVAETAAKALGSVLPHCALILVNSVGAVPVQIAAAAGTRERLAATDWMQLLRRNGPVIRRIGRISLPDVVGGLHVAGWAADSGGCTVTLIIGDRAAFHLSAGQERSAMRVTMQVAARAWAIDTDPPPGTLAFSRAISHERERIRLELQSRYAGALSTVLYTLRNATEAGGVRVPGVAKAIDLTSRAMLDLQAESDSSGVTDVAPVGTTFAEIEEEVAALLHAAGVRLVADLEADSAVPLLSSIAHAGRLITRAAVLNMIEHSERTSADKARLLWRISEEALIIVVADNGGGSDLAAGRVEQRFGEIRRWASELGGEVAWDVHADWGTTLRCRLPLHQPITVTETHASRRLAALGDRERGVLELMVAGLRNRAIAERLYISERTVKFHVSNILAKLEVASRTEAIALAHSAGLSVPSLD